MNRDRVMENGPYYSSGSDSQRMYRNDFKLPLALSEGLKHRIFEEYWYQNPFPKRFISELSSYCLTELARRIRELRTEETENA